MIVSWQDIDTNPNLVGQRIASAQAGWSYDYIYFPMLRRDEMYQLFHGGNRTGYRIEVDESKKNENPSIIIWTVYREG